MDSCGLYSFIKLSIRLATAMEGDVSYCNNCMQADNVFPQGLAEIFKVAVLWESLEYETAM